MLNYKMRLVLLFMSLVKVLTGNEIMKIYDYIVVGSGAPGSVVANRLSENSQIQVLLLEAGDHANLLSEIPMYYPFLQQTQYDWNYTVQLPSYPNLNIQRSPAAMPQGKAVGGTSVINSMMYIRGHRLDYDDWARSGARGWDWNHVLPYFLKSEKNMNTEFVSNELHGTQGEVYVQYSSYASSALDKYLKAAMESGFQIGDINNYNQSTFGRPQLTIRNSRRWGINKAFIYSIKGRKNFHLLSSAFVRKIIFNENKEAVGVEYDYQGKIKTAFAKEEIIVSAGTIKSAQLLMLSGIGPAQELNNFGIAVISNLPVGENFQDHAIVITPIFKISNLHVNESDYKQYLSSGKGILAGVPTEVVGFYSSKYSVNPVWPDSEIIFVTLVSSAYLPTNDLKATVLCGNLVERPKSRGKISLSNSDPNSPPIIDARYLSDESDVNVLIEGVKMCETLANTQSMQSVGEKVIGPRFEPCIAHPEGSDSYYGCVVKHTVAPAYHLVGTCKMGNENDPSTVVDPTLKVKGVKGLRVVDASVAPQLIVGHPFAVSMMIGEKGADMIYEDYLIRHKSGIYVPWPGKI